MSQKRVIIIGAGPAGLTAAYELLQKSDIKPVIYEATGDIGGISKTVNHNGNRIDIGGHRFFSKSDRVMEWWRSILPYQGAPARDDITLGRDIPLSDKPGAPDPETNDAVMLVRSRLSRIFFLRSFFDYPISLNIATFMNLGPIRLIKIGLSYAKIVIFPIRNEKSLEDFFINRFGKELYLTFFKDYTEKVWGTPCDQIKPEWGAQRIKGLSITRAVLHALKTMVSKDDSFDQKQTETSLIGQFFYPKYGPGQMWERVADLIRERGGEIHLFSKVEGVHYDAGKIVGIDVDGHGRVTGDHYISTMPVRSLIRAFDQGPDEAVKKVAAGLVYRDFITVGLLLNKLKVQNQTTIKTVNDIVPDNWIYIQERDVKVGRLQIFNNWSPYMVADASKVWIGLEYFCNEGDTLWSMDDEAFKRFAIDELAKIDIIHKDDAIDATVIRMPKTYPAYFGSYDQFATIREFTDTIPNLFLIGRNGMHRYNNMDHSMLSAMTAIENILAGETGKENIWAVNTEEEFHETKSAAS